MKSLSKIILITIITYSLQFFTIDSTHKFILDKNNRPSIFHGVNVVYKLPPYIPDTEKFDPLYSLSKEDIKIMKKLGFNFVRLGIIWESVEKEEGKYDMEYLNKMEEIINNLGKNGIYTMIDNHQDCFSRNFCGEGVPYFYLDKIGYDKKCDANILSRLLGLFNICKPMSSFNFRYDDNNLHLIEDCKTENFLQYHFTPDFISAYKSFYENKYNIQEKFVEFWKVISNKFKNNEYVIGYDLWNEPFPGGIFNDLSKLIPSNPDNKQVLPLYRKVDKEIRKINPNYILFFENTPFPDNYPIFGGLILGKFNETPSDKNNNQVYNIHSYCCLAGASVCEEGEPILEHSKTTCLKYHNKKIKKNTKAAEELNVPLFLSEFGACSDSENCYNEIINVVKGCEKNFVSWAYWNYKPYGDHTTSAIKIVDKEGIFNLNGTVQYIKEKSLSRSYIQYYQGYPISFNYFDDSDTDFESEFIYNDNITEGTILYFNKEFFYQKGFSLKVFDDKGNLVDGEFKVFDENYIDIKLKAVLNGKKVKVVFKKN